MKPWMDRAFAAIDRCLRRAPEGAMSPSDVRDVLLVGGPDTPCFSVGSRRSLAAAVGGDDRPPRTSRSARHTRRSIATRLENGRDPQPRSQSRRRMRRPGRAGIMRAGMFDVLLEAGRKFPAESTHDYWSVTDDQETINVAVYESMHEAERVDGLDLLARRDFRIPKGPARSFTILRCSVTTFSRTPNGGRHPGATYERGMGTSASDEVGGRAFPEPVSRDELQMNSLAALMDFRDKWRPSSLEWRPLLRRRSSPNLERRWIAVIWSRRNCQVATRHPPSSARVSL